MSDPVDDYNDEVERYNADVERDNAAVDQAALIMRAERTVYVEQGLARATTGELLRELWRRVTR